MKTKVNVSNSHKFSTYLNKNTPFLHYKYQPISVAQTNDTVHSENQTQYVSTSCGNMLTMLVLK